MTTIATLYKITLGYGPDDTAHYTCGSYKGAVEFMEKRLASDNKLEWYSIEGISWHPCDESNPGGQLYGGGICFEYHDVEKKEG